MYELATLLHRVKEGKTGKDATWKASLPTRSDSRGHQLSLAMLNMSRSIRGWSKRWEVAAGNDGSTKHQIDDERSMVDLAV